MLIGENSICKLYYFEQKSFLFIQVSEQPEFTLEAVKNSYRQSYELTGARKVYTFTDARNFNFSYLPKEVFTYMSDNPFVEYQHNNAILIDSLAQRILGNFYLNVFNPKVNTRLFTDKKAAVDWIFKNSQVSYQNDQAFNHFIDNA
jgi:hypothetical protein